MQHQQSLSYACFPRSLLLRLLLFGGTSLRGRSSIVVVVVVVMGLDDLLAQFLLSLVNICVKFVSVLADRELLVVVDRNINLSCTHRFVFRIMELRNIGVSQSLFGS